MDEEKKRMKIIWRIAREALNAAARQLAVRILAGLLAGVGAVDVAGRVADALGPADVPEVVDKARP